MHTNLPTKHTDVLERMAEWGVTVGSFFDVGAAAGMWGPMIRRHWPEAQLYFFEAAPAWKEKLEAAAASFGGTAEVMIAAAGDVDGTAYFRYDPDNQYGGAIIDEPADNAIQVPKVRLDSFIADRSPARPFALKLDVHGAERLILAGAEEFMTMCDFVILETYNFGPATRRFGQMAVFMEERYGLRCIDIAEQAWRPYDNALWQLDLYFVRPEGTKLMEWRLQ